MSPWCSPMAMVVTGRFTGIVCSFSICLYAM